MHKDRAAIQASLIVIDQMLDWRYRTRDSGALIGEFEINFSHFHIHCMDISCRWLLHFIIADRFYISFLQIPSVFHFHRSLLHFISTDLRYQQLRVSPDSDRKICRRLKIIGHPNEIDEHTNVNGDCGLVTKFHLCTISLKWPIKESEIFNRRIMNTRKAS